MLHELHIFGPLPAAILQEALRGLSAEPFDGAGALFDLFRLRTPHGVRNGSPDGTPIRRSDNAQSEQFGRTERAPLDAAQSYPPVGVQSWRIRGLRGAGDRRRLLGALLVPVREARATALLRVAGSGIRGAAFDLEGTLTELEFVDALAGRLGFGERMQTRTSASMTGRTSDFRRDYEERMAALRGVEVAVMEEVIGSMTLAAGVGALCDRLHAAAIPVAVISGGCSRLGEAVRKKIAVRALYATAWEECAGRFTGRAASPVVDPAGKRRALEDFARSTSCPLENMAAAGDGANDIEMLSAAGTALLTHATARPAWPGILAALL